MGQCANTIPWIVNYALTAFSLIILSINLKLVMQIYENSQKNGKIWINKVSVWY